MAGYVADFMTVLGEVHPLRGLVEADDLNSALSLVLEAYAPQLEASGASGFVLHLWPLERPTEGLSAQLMMRRGRPDVLARSIDWAPLPTIDLAVMKQEDPQISLTAHETVHDPVVYRTIIEKDPIE